MFNLGLILKTLRDQHGYTQVEAANKLNIKSGTVSNWENNVSRPSSEKLIELAFLYNTPLNYLLGESLEETLLINNLTPDQQNILKALVNEFSRERKLNVRGKYTLEQKQILDALFEQFSKV